MSALRSAFKELFRKDEHFRTLVMEMPVSVLVLRGPELEVEFINNRLLHALNKRWRHVIGRPFFQVFPELQDQGYNTIFYGVYESGDTFMVSQLPISVSRNGNPTYFINLSVQALTNPEGSITGLFIVGSDVTELVKMREQVQESENKYRNVLDLMDPGFSIMEMIFDENNKPYDYTFLEVNPAWAEMVKMNDLVGKTMRQIMPEGFEYWIELFGMVALTGEKVTVLKEMPQMGKTFESHAFRIGGEGSKKVAVLFNDITKRVKEEELRQKFANELEQQVTERTRELERAYLELKQFAHLISHDLKEPVRKIKTFVSMLTDDLINSLDDKHKGYFDKILTSCDRLKDMIEGVYDYSAVNVDEDKISQVNLNNLINKVIDDLELKINEKKAIINMGILPTIEAKSFQIHQLFYNLISNSLKFSREDTQCRIDITSQIVEKDHLVYAAITIQDNGLGFDPSENERIFETFTRLHPKTKFEGTGLGLPLSKKIAEKHCGTIEAAGEPGVGARFTVYLPFKKREP